MKKNIHNTIKCPICKTDQTEMYVNINHSVASDASLVSHPVTTYFCSNCFNFFKKRNKIDSHEIQSIYERYVLHNRGRHVEQRVAFDKFADGIEKSKHIANFLFENIEIQNSGKLLDIGCHFGSFLNFFHKKRHNWLINGYDISPRFSETIKAISATAKYFHSNINTINEKFDLITISHVLEHVDQPIEILNFVKTHLTNNGLLLFECNNSEENPFLPLIYEQHYNFSIPGLYNIFDMVGLKIKTIKTNWVPKEISIIAQVAKENEYNFITQQIKKETTRKIKKNEFLLNKSIISLNRLKKGKQKIGILGTAYVARWMAKELSEKVDFFIDENPLIQGIYVHNRPVYSTNETPNDSLILVALPLEISYKVIDRLQDKLRGCILLPPPFNETK